MSNTSGLMTLKNGMLRKEKAFRDEIEWNHHNSIGFASRLTHGGTLEGLLGEEDIQMYRESLKEIAKDNVEKERQLQAYINAVGKLGNDGQDEEVGDIQAKLEKAVKEEQEKIDKTSIQITQESTYLDLCRELGEDQGKEDDDIAVLPMENGEQSLKCPLTATLMENPVKNKICKHTYSRAAIMQHIAASARNCVCPVAGCQNRNVTASQLEEDKLMETLVRRFKTRQQLSQKCQSALDVEQEEDDE
jgi:hypothetical protein